ncbi:MULTISPECIES: hypothetical protein [unclassified Candidatus Frackibacter]|uniref:hypothetical protein n=1 Tax=unclassified Candidatus Frackibacter TaxID=2648818 RepID=UPI00088B1925|nr:MULTISPECIES: hypothetical protein [unclassified Candidatus Frackibacter]SDC59928.1 hypothetical protein SAMN04515661_11545 [Candidatus Frackibacter sp. WG11]SEM41951.1 hypothetical protein SAMN04488698_103111 [Candidatus Frackibacter sp. WG12]SFL84643.1 hypothetical protein SAMN04488699_11618 [Candidatus Frackibacter sp. WG13]
MGKVIVSKYMAENNLNFHKLIRKFKDEKELGYKYFRKDIEDIHLNSEVELFEYKIRPNICYTTRNALPLLPIPIKRETYQRYNNRFKLLEELAIAKIAFEKEGYRPKQINIKRELIDYTIRLIHRHYDYQDPYLGTEIIWVDLKPNILKTLDYCFRYELNGISNGLLIKSS